MPSRRCEHPTCAEFVAADVRRCPAHAAAAPARRERDRYYDQHVRRPDAKAFYNSARWKRTRANALADHPVCQRCVKAWAEHVHHVIPLERCTFEEQTDRANLLTVCPPCHNTIEAEASADA